MKLSEKQALVMFDVLKWSLQLVGGAAGYDTGTLHKLINNILNQQSENPVELDNHGNV